MSFFRKLFSSDNIEKDPSPESSDDKKRRSSKKDDKNEVKVAKEDSVEKKKDENYFEGELLDAIFQGESQLLVIKLTSAESEEQVLRVRIPNQSVTDKALPAIGEKVTIALKVADSYVVS